MIIIFLNGQGNLNAKSFIKILRLQIISLEIHFVIKMSRMTSLFLSNY